MAYILYTIGCKSLRLIHISIFRLFSYASTHLHLKGCRVVINMQRLAKEKKRAFGQRGSASTSSPQLTSCIFDTTPFPRSEGDVISSYSPGSQSRKMRPRDSRTLPSPIESQASTSEDIKAVLRDQNRDRRLRGAEIITTPNLTIDATKHGHSNSYSYPSYGKTPAQTLYPQASLKSISSSTLQPTSSISHSRVQLEAPSLPPLPLASPLKPNPPLNSTVAVARMQIMIRSQ